jgi:hypothetical protein
MSIAEGLQQSTYESKDRDSHQARLPAPFVGAGKCHQRANNGSRLHDADEVCGEIRFLNLTLAFIAELTTPV